MATNKNITMKQFNGTDYDTLYPKTIASQVDGVYSKEDVLSDGTKTLFGLSSTAVPDDVFSALSNAVTKKVIMEHTFDRNSTVKIELSTIDWSKKIIIVLDPCELASASWVTTMYDGTNASFGNFYITEIIPNLELKTYSSTDAANFHFNISALNGERVFIELYGNGVNSRDNYIQNLQMVLRYDQYFYYALFTPRISHFGLSGEAGSKITVYSID